MLALREAAAECLREIISKGMEPLPKIELVESLAKMLLSLQVLSTAADEVLHDGRMQSICKYIEWTVVALESPIIWTIELQTQFMFTWGLLPGQRSILSVQLHTLQYHMHDYSTCTVHIHVGLLFFMFHSVIIVMALACMHFHVLAG